MLTPGTPTDGYARVSTDDQADKGSSMRAQVAEIRAACGRLGLDLRHLEEDGGESSKTLERPGLRRILDRLDTGEIRGVMVAHQDRLTRNLEDACTLVRRYFTGEGGAELLTPAGPVDTRSAAGRFTFFVLVTVSQFQRESGVEKTVATLDFKRGGSELLGRAKFGFRVDPTLPARSKADNPIGLVVDADDVAAAAQIRLHHAEGRSLRQIARLLDGAGYLPKRGHRWSPSSVAKILKSPSPEVPDVQAHCS